MASRASTPQRYRPGRTARTCAWWFALAVLLLSPSTDALAQLTYYQNRPTFDGAFPGLPVEGFELSLVPPGQQRACAGPFNSQTQNLCFGQGGILDGISLDAIQVQGDGQMAVFTNGFFGLASDAVGANTPFDELEISFPDAEVFAVGMDLLSPITGAFTVNIDIYGPGENNVLDETEATTGAAQGVFWGVSSDSEPITRIVFRVAGSSDFQPHLMVDDVAFGIQKQQLVIRSVTPTAIPTLGVGEAVTYTITVVDPQGNPVPGARVEVDDALLGAVITVAATDNQGRITYETVVPENTPEGFYTLAFVAQHDEFDDSKPVARQVEVQYRQLVIQSVTPSAIPTLDVGDAAPYTITVVDPENNPVPGAQVEVDDGLLDVVITVGSTDDAGQIVYETVVPENKPEGFYTLSFVAQHDDFDDSDPVERQVEVRHREPGLAVTPTTVAFGRVRLGETETRPVTLSNTGDGPLSVQAIRITGADAGDFSRPSLNLPLVIAPGGSTSFSLGFQPGARSVRNAALEVDSDGGNARVPVTGEGAAPGISVEPASVEYGDVAVGSFANATVTVTNTGNDNLTIETVRITGADAAAFEVLSGGGTRVLEVGSEQSVIVRFTPPDTGVRNATLEILSDAVDDAGNAVDIVAVPLSGGGAVSALDVTPDMVDFGTTRIGAASGEQTVTLTNAGNVDLTLQIRLAGTDAGAFSILSGGGGSVLTPSDPPRDVVLQYAPTRAGAQATTLIIQWNAATTVVALRGSGVEVRLDPPEPSGPAEAGQALAVSLTLPEGFEPTTRQLFFRRGGETAYQPVDLQDDAGGGLEGAIPADFVTERGVDYYVRLSDGVTTLTFPETDPEGNPLRLRVEVALLDAGGVFRPGVYRMVSAPLELTGTTVHLQDDYGPFDPTRWRALRWQPQAEVYVEAGSGQPLESDGLRPGLAIWLITRAGEGFDVEEGRSTDTSEPFAINLPPGWSQIGDPFAFPVAVSSIANSGAVQGPYFYDGTEYLPNQSLLEPWEGYFVLNPNPTPVTLSVAPVEAVAAPKRAASEDLFPEADFMLQVRAELPGLSLRDTQNYVGFAEAAAAQPHRFNLAEPPPIGDHLRLSILNDEQRYVSYFKPAGEDGGQWDFEVTASVEGASRFEPRLVQITLVEHSARPAGFDLYVFDRDLGRVLPVEGGAFQVALMREYPVRHFSLVLGTTAFAEAHSEGASLTPAAFVLEANYPNPFNPETVIRYGIDRQSPVALEIFNVLGQRVRTLVEGEQPSGVYEVVWDGLDEAGRPAASGLYVYQLRAGAFVASRKMLLLR